MTDHDKAREWRKKHFGFIPPACADKRMHLTELQLDKLLADYAAKQTRAKDERIRVLEEALRHASAWLPHAGCERSNSTVANIGQCPRCGAQAVLEQKESK